LIRRRAFLGGSLALLAAPFASLAAGPVRSLAPPRRFAVSDGLAAALEESPFVYVSPLLADGTESTCHGEVWYAWLDGAVVINTAPSTWKARAQERGLDLARIWVGDHGRWKRMIGRNEAFRKAPSFDARVVRSRDAALTDRLLDVYARKYPDEIGQWREKMRQGVASGERVLLLYAPLDPSGELPRT